MSDFDDDPPRLNDLHSFAHHLASGRSGEAGITLAAREEIAAYLLGYAARLRFPLAIAPTDESMCSERVTLLGPTEARLDSRLRDDCRRSFANGWTDAGEALTLAITSPT